MLSRNMITSKQALEIVKRRKESQSYATIEKEMNISLSKILTISRLYLEMNVLEAKIYGCLLDAAIDVEGRPGQVDRVYRSLKSYGYLRSEKLFLKLKDKSNKELMRFRQIGKKSIEIIRRAIDIFEDSYQDAK